MIMKLIVYDVGNAACSIIKSPNGYGMMIDCGCNSDKPNPVDSFLFQKDWHGIRPYTTLNGQNYSLGLLHITHPDDDHVRNAKKIKSELPPYLLQKRDFEEFPQTESINEDYKKYIDKKYRGNNPEKIDWGFDIDKTFRIPMDTLLNDETLNKKIKNNSSILRFLKYQEISVLYAGDLEKEAWDWLATHNNDFRDTISRNGVGILIAPHHGHKSGFPSALFDLCGNVNVVIHSKGSEGSIDGTNVSNQYSGWALGVNYINLNDKSYYSGKVLTTRSNGNIYIEIQNQNLNVWTDTASPNHKRL